jgi:hypothetical protein
VARGRQRRAARLLARLGLVRLAHGRRSFWPLRPLRPLATSATRAAEASRPAGAALTPSAGPTARSTPHPLDLSRELGQLIAVELAIAIGIKLHRMLNKPLG